MIRSVDRRTVLIIGLMLLVTGIFWGGSRYPDLSEKAIMGENTQLDGLGFDTLIEINPNASVPTRIVFTAINWLDTNKRGMTFGIILAASLMTLLSLLNRRGFSNTFSNTFLGAAIGAPLGVCVNCAAPIARGLHTAGARLETSLATMISSPTLNIIVLTILFSLYPLYVAMTKLVLTVFFIIFGIPIITRVLLRLGLLPTTTGAYETAEVCEVPQQLVGGGAAPAVDNWLDALVWTGSTFAKNLWFIVKTTVPLMVLAGFLGAAAIVVVPWEALSSWLATAAPTGVVAKLSAMTVVAFLGVFLPVPMAFDVIIVSVLITAGMPIEYAMVLLFTLGIFSVYSFNIVWSSISKIVALTLFTSLVALGVVAGAAASILSDWHEAGQREQMFRVLAEQVDPTPAQLLAKGPAVAGGPLVSSLTHVDFEPIGANVVDAVSVSGAPFSQREVGGTTAADEPRFTRKNGAELGIDEPAPFSLLKQLPPRYWGRGIAAGDVHNDGWTDLVIASDSVMVKGLSLYTNQGGRSFVRQDIPIPSLEDLEIINVALVDLNNDGWLDLFLSAFQGGNKIVYNRDGLFTEEGLRSLPETDSVVAAAVAFGDLDVDGDLDIFLGNWSAGYLNPLPGEYMKSRNILLRQDGGEFVAEKLDDMPAETLAALFSDYNGDNIPDLIVGNDFGGSDLYYASGEEGDLRQVTKASGVIPHTTGSTMSIVSADLNNDLVPEIFLAQMAMGGGENFARNLVPSIDICEEYVGQTERNQCVQEIETNMKVSASRRGNDVRQCLSIENEVHRYDCVAMNVLWAAWKQKDQSYCDLLPETRTSLVNTCIHMFEEKISATEESQARSIPEIGKYNVLLVSDGKNGFEDRALPVGLGVTGWTWNAKFADLNNDGFKDLFVANGAFQNDTRESNYFFENDSGENFVDRTDDYGLEDYRATGSYVYLDIENDGDLDIISLPISGPVRALINNSRTGRAIQISLRDQSNGNRFGIGSRIFIFYGPEGRQQQMQEISASGGFLSFDAPIAHFGLGSADRVERVEVEWSTGEKTELTVPLRAGGHYIITRGG